MHIKKIIIQGFKTYKNATIIDDLSPRCNVVVGRNGSGKSNFFAAIRFVLSDAYTHMTREERQGLIHEGSGTVISAYVEIIFDNSDGRFPLNKSEVLIRRTIGLKKDDYSLDGKSATRSDIKNLLESAGFSRSNPYYIVPQGRITSLTNSKDNERLSLLKEVSGATVFENKLKESQKEMTASNLKRERINETLQTIEDRLNDLRIESADLKKFQALEKQKKILEYNIFDREFNELNESLQDLDDKYQQLKNDFSNDLKDLETREKLCLDLQDSINELKIELKVVKLEKEQTDLDFNQLLKLIADNKIKLNEVKNQSELSNEKSGYFQEQIKQFRNDIELNEKIIFENKPQLEKLQQQEQALKENLVEITSKQRALYSKQNRLQKFSHKQQRDQWLIEEISKLKKSLQSKEQDLHQVSNEIKSRELTYANLSKQIEELDKSLNDDERIKALAELKNTISNYKSELNDLTNQRKILWRNEIRLKSVYDSLTNDLNNATNAVNRTMDNAQAQGIIEVKSIAKQLNIEDKVYGIIAELFTVNDKYKTVAEVIAGNSLFHIVVDSDDTAALIMDELIKLKKGRVTFVPLNRIQNTPTEYPNSNENECIPLITKIKHDVKVSKAMNQIFAKTLVVRDLSKGGELSKSYKLTCITLDGDRVDNKGVLSGGYRDYKNSRIDALRVQIKKRKELIKTETELKSVSKSIEEMNQKTTKINNELQLSIRDLEKLSMSKEPIKIELSQKNNKKFNLEQELSSFKVNFNNLKQSKNAININLKQHEQELNSEFEQALSNEERTQLQEYNSKVSSMENELDKIVTESVKLDNKISKLESELDNNLKPKLNNVLKEQGIIGNKSFIDSQVSQLNEEMENLQIQLDTAQTRMDQVNENYEKLNNEISNSENELKKANQQQLTIMKNLEKFSKLSTKLLNQKQIKISSRETVNKSIRDLGVLPEEAFNREKYDSKSSNELINKLSEINQQLSKYSHLNKKSLEQFNIFTKQRDELISRRLELDQSKESIENLISNLQQQKNEAIIKSFKQISTSFSKIFEKLVPTGKGELLMQKKDENVDDLTIDNYSGVAISVSFNSRNYEQQRIEQLSGGQKSLCAITLIFAIQNCDPAPFYLFDEIDSNLDNQYRTSVANLINSQTDYAQFICTTFRPEMLQLSGDKFYGVNFSNKVSSINEINKDEALAFVEGHQNR
ncbi:unnamed protein product [Candida verbasci]|uniref:Structural maintenance of chromosomes protein n=1 Tax=Candida verbasci TaxID=1227364 RepID=A0A9W4TXX1_9ASCO|nr:unnamed protein product [Candida verbasci]